MRSFTAGALTVCLIFFITFWVARKSFVTANPQVAEGSWQISVQVPPCSGDLKIIPPEREGSVVTIYCDYMPVKEK